MSNLAKLALYDDLYMDIADRCAQMSYGIRAKVGCLIVRDGRILSMGWNGMPAGMPNECEEKVYSNPWTYTLVTRQEVSHAEENAITKLARSTESSEGCTAYVTMAPCMNCAKLLFNSGIVRVKYRNTYKDDSGLIFLKNRNIEVTQV